MNLASILKLVFTAIQMVPAVVQGIENIHQNTVAGAAKKDLALQSLMLASGVAGAIDPQDSATIDAVSQVIGHTIDSSVSLYNATGWGHKSTPIAVVPVSSAAAAGASAAASAGTVKNPGDVGY